MILEKVEIKNDLFAVGDILVDEDYSFLITYYDASVNQYAIVCLDGEGSIIKLNVYTKEGLLELIKDNDMVVYSKNKYKLKIVELV